MISLGGTIAMATEVAGSGVVPSLSAAALLAAVPSLADTGIFIRAHSFRSLPGASLTLADLAELVTDVGHEPMVITQGTDTIEETAYYLDLTLTRDAPVVVTGAMRNPTLAGADGPANLLAAVQVAASRHSRGLGCVVVLNDEIHAARNVRKTHSTSPAAFSSPDTGPIGRVVEGQPQIHHYPTPQLSLTPGRHPGRVAVIPTWLGDDGALLHAAADSVDGLVIAAFGAGHVPATLVPVLSELVTHMPVVLATRTGAGPVLRATYGFDGSERDLQDRGLINAGWLSPYQARILLHLLLTQATTREEVTATFTAASTGPDPT